MYIDTFDNIIKWSLGLTYEGKSMKNKVFLFLH